MNTNDIPAPTPAVSAWLETHARTYASGEKYFVDDANHVILDPTRAGLPNADTLGAAAWLHRHRPELWGEHHPATRTASDAPTPSSASDLMALVRSGSLSPNEATSRIFNAQAAAASPPKKTMQPLNVTEAMVAARRGEPDAIQFLNNFAKGAR